MPGGKCSNCIAKLIRKCARLAKVFLEVSTGRVFFNAKQANSSHGDYVPTKYCVTLVFLKKTLATQHKLDNVMPTDAN